MDVNDIKNKFDQIIDFNKKNDTYLRTVTDRPIRQKSTMAARTGVEKPKGTWSKGLLHAETTVPQRPA